DIDPVKITEEGEDESSFLATFFVAYAGIILFMILILTTGQSLVRGLVEEKSNRIMEMLVSSATPRERMWGKLLGLSGLGITQVLACTFLGLGGILFFSVEVNFTMLSALPYILMYRLVGYFFYASI